MSYIWGQLHYPSLYLGFCHDYNTNKLIGRSSVNWYDGLSFRVHITLTLFSNDSLCLNLFPGDPFQHNPFYGSHMENMNSKLGGDL